MAGLGSQSPNNREGLSAVSSISGNNEYVYSTNHALNVNASFSPSGTQDVNLTQVGGATLSLGQTTMSASIPVTIASNQSALSLAGAKSNNTAVPGATNLGTLPGIATAAAPTYSEGFQVGLSTDLAGALRVTGSLSIGGTTDNSAFTAGTSTGTPAMGFYHSTIDTVTDGRAATVGITSKRALLVNLNTAAGVEIGTAASPIQVSLANTSANATAVKVDGSAVTQPISYATTGHGTATGAIRVELPTDGTGVIATVSAVTAITNALPAGTNLLGKVGIDQTTPGTTNKVSLSDGSGNSLPSTTSEPAAGDRGLEVREAGTGFVSANNSSTATLASNATFTGTADTATNYASATIYVYSDQASATNGLSIQQSSDGTNWDITDIYTVPAITGKTFAVQITAANFRIVYTNGAVAQSAFRLQVILHKYLQPTSSTRPQDNRTNDTDMTENLAYLNGYSPTTNSWNRLRGSISNGLEVDVTRIKGTQSFSLDQINQAPIISADTGVQLVGIADSMGAPLSSTGSSLNVVVTQGGIPKGSVAYYNGALTNTVVPVRVGGGVISGFEFQNPSSANAYVQIFDRPSGLITLGTTAPTYSFFVPALGAQDKPLLNIPYANGLYIAATTTVAGSSAPGTALVVNIW